MSDRILRFNKIPSSNDLKVFEVYNKMTKEVIGTVQQFKAGKNATSSFGVRVTSFSCQELREIANFLEHYKFDYKGPEEHYLVINNLDHIVQPGPPHFFLESDVITQVVTTAKSPEFLGGTFEIGPGNATTVLNVGEAGEANNAIMPPVPAPPLPENITTVTNVDEQQGKIANNGVTLPKPGGNEPTMGAPEPEPELDDIEVYDPAPGKVKILYKFASRSRPEKFFMTLDNIIASARHDEYVILVTLDEDDATMNNEEVKYRLNRYPNVLFIFGQSKSKIGAINRDMDQIIYPWDILFVVSDDQMFIKDGFDLIVMEDMQKHFPDFDGFLHYPDADAGEKVPTMSIMGREYYKRDHYIYFPEYYSLWSDNEAMQVAKIRGKYRFINNRIYDHTHPLNTVLKGQWDEQYKKTEAFYRLDESTFIIRQSKGFGIRLLDVLIPTLMKRSDMLNRLCDTLTRQKTKLDEEFGITGLCNTVNLVFYPDNGEISIGAKRQWLLENSKARYVCFFDDDDRPGENYFKEIMPGILTGADCCSLIGVITENGSNPKRFVHAVHYKKYFEENGVYYRPPNHLNCIKREIANQVKFPDKSFSEDTDWAMELSNRQLIHSEWQVSEPIYFYDYISNK